LSRRQDAITNTILSFTFQISQVYSELLVFKSVDYKLDCGIYTDRESDCSLAGFVSPVAYDAINRSQVQFAQKPFELKFEPRHNDTWVTVTLA
jgi:hypothetical protein